MHYTRKERKPSLEAIEEVAGKVMNGPKWYSQIVTRIALDLESPALAFTGMPTDDVTDAMKMVAYPIGTQERFREVRDKEQIFLTAAAAGIIHGKDIQTLYDEEYITPQDMMEKLWAALINDYRTLGLIKQENEQADTQRMHDKLSAAVYQTTLMCNMLSGSSKTAGQSL